MDQNSGNSGTGNSRQDMGSEDASKAREHVRAAEENRDALEAQSRRTEATAPDSVGTPVGSSQGGMNTSGNRDASGGGPGSLNATGTGRTTEDTSVAREHVRAAEENRDALADENRRVENTTPPDVSTGR